MRNGTTITINGRRVTVAAGSSVAVALLNSGAASRISVSGEPRAPLCGMGVCMECRATVNGVEQQRTCQIVCEESMEVVTG